MSTKPIVTWTLLLILLSAATARAQIVQPQPDLGDRNTAPESELMEAPPTQVWPPQTGPSPWILYSQRPGCDCCGPIGNCGPIRMELFTQTGPSRPVTGDYVAKAISTGWLVGGGGRSLFFNRAMDAAWNVDLSLNYIFNNGGHTHLQTLFPQIVNNADGTQDVILDEVSVAALHRTYLSLGLGREWFLPGPTLNGQNNLIFGVDGGVRYGVVRLDFHNYDVPGQFQRTTDILWGGYVGVHADYEIPCNCCTYFFGFRAEWSYMDFEIMPNQEQRIHDINLLLTGGVRF